ncbi:MAG TPA: exodeoxyribonuclease VII large subunit [Gemmatimonadales bacterium]
MIGVVHQSGGTTALSVSELVGVLRNSVESAARQVWVKGEVSSLKSFGKGDWYFTLRDAESCIRCVMWKTYTVRVGEPPAEGTEVYALGNPTVWEKKGELKFPVVVLLPTAGTGLQQLGKEKVRAALEKDGLLAPERKRPLPEFPSVLAVVTSQDGAALHDIIIVARRRWPRVRLLIVPAQVQGDGAPAALVRAIGRVNRLEGVDLCVVARGGGSREDLLAFDDERVCRAIAALRMPSICAVGHETDLSLADLVADMRAATPSAAMELALPDRVHYLRHAGSLGTRLAHGLRRRNEVLEARLARSGDRIRMAMGRRITEPRSRMERLAAQLEALSPLAVLARGYSVARLADGRVARRRADLPSGTGFTLRVSDGEVPSRSE